MKDFAGTPGTATGLALRISQCVFAAGAAAVMVSYPGFNRLTAFCYLVGSMGLQLTWSFGLVLLDAYALLRKKSLRDPLLICLLAVGDWVMGMLSLSAASSSAGVTVLYYHDVGDCSAVNGCSTIVFSVVLSFLGWILIQTSSLIMFWLLASSV